MTIHQTQLIPAPRDITHARGGMRIAVVGPTHPYKGGIAQYTTTLVHQLAGIGHEVTLEFWSLAALADTLSRFYAEGEPQRLRAGVPQVDAAPAWRKYCAALLTAATR
jgi:RPA family protein